jgi:type VI secretion system secreted protein VgrG
VYNGLNQPFHKLPDEKTKSYLRTSSSPGNEGYNELLFEDKKGEEQVYLHAQKDLKEEVENAHSLSIKATRSVSVGGNESYTISGKRTKSVGGKDEKGEGIEIHGDRLTTVSKNETFSVTEHQKHTIGKGRDVTVSEDDDNLTVAKGHKTTRVKSKYTIFSEDQFAISQGASEEAKVVLNKQVHVETTGSFTLTNKETTIQGTPSGELKIEASSGLTIVCGSASIKLSKDGSLEVSGVKVMVGTKTNNAKFDSAGVAVSGAKVSSTAMTLNEIKGPMIKIGC